ncbi:unnamed protein product [Phytophthora fragariaefolia]|uniref:Unnamed protein product n=1 Tax=Phytophthora fragariaefolia TaxID=1490495 RepID=A0A9W6XB26_9STRA|nr:unnamed protein product [Phytophthora fragariaefolia]
MRLPFAVTMAIVVQLSGASATSVSADGPVAVTIVDHLLNAAHDSITTSTRLLRTVDADSKTETSGEDRLNIPGLETLSHYVWKLSGSPVNGKTIQGWLRKDTSEIEAFKLLKLDKAGDKLLASSKFRGWLRYVEVLERYPQIQVGAINTLRMFYTDKQLALMCQNAIRNPHMAQVAEKLQTMLFKQWRQEGKKPYSLFADAFTDTTMWKADPTVLINHEYDQWFRGQ